jgi:drug/metabolite transporter (DMT)-like permease
MWYYLLIAIFFGGFIGVWVGQAWNDVTAGVGIGMAAAVLMTLALLLLRYLRRSRR